jgi:hypothetical protein
MKVRSTIPLPFSADRAGVHLAIIEIDFQITQRNDIDKSYSLVAIDYTINDHITIAIRNSMPESMRLQYIDSPGRRDWKKNYIKSYEEYDYQRAYFMDTSGLTGSDLEDKLLQDVLLYSCMTDTVYSSGYEDWVAYSDPIPAEPVTVESTHRHLRL